MDLLFLFSKELREFRNELLKIKERQNNVVTLEKWEQDIIESIRRQTEKHNLNNVTRTKAYLSFYLRYPEIHWSFLAHMVSRNGGWNMTDLKGDLLPNLLTNQDRKNLFSFIERGNWLIFQDAFPQLLLYEYSLIKEQNLFYLLPYLHVSIFMEAAWNDFWKKKNHKLLAIATIINEQNYIEKRLIQNKIFQKNVLNTFEFKLYDFLPFNHILFPYSNEGERPKLVGATVHHFASLHERILFGKLLYSLLFLKKGIHDKVLSWAKEHPHTGSRSDYWNDLFSPIKISVNQSRYEIRTRECQLKKGALPLYSPYLEKAWSHVIHEKALIHDWFQDVSVLKYLKDSRIPSGDIYDDYCLTIEAIELAVAAKSLILG